MKENCVSSNPDQICLSLKYVAYRLRGYKPVVSEDEAVDTVRSVNGIWHRCGIAFQIDHYLAIDPQQYDFQFNTSEAGEFNQIRRAFRDPFNLLVVATGEWDRDEGLGWANAWTNMPGDAPFGVVLEEPVGREPAILAHELGHYLGLDHIEDRYDLMNPIVYSRSVELSAEQCKAAREGALAHWKNMFR